MWPMPSARAAAGPRPCSTPAPRAHRARAASPLRPGRWTHLAATYDGSSIRLLVGGVEVARTPASGALLAAPGPLRIGAGGTGGDRFVGRIDEVRVYGRALPKVEIVRDMRHAVRTGRNGGSTTPVIVNPTPTAPFTPTVPLTPGGPGVGPSGDSVPVGDLPGWQQVFADDFPTNVPEGGWTGCNGSTGRCSGLPSAVRDKWFSYPDGWKDTSKLGTYMPSAVNSIAARCCAFGCETRAARPR